MIGYYGNLMFEVNSDWMQYPSKFERTASGRWQVSYPGNGGRPVKQFMGPETGGITFTMHFDQRFTSDVREMIDMLVSWTNTGYTDVLVIGNKPLGYNEWYCDSVKILNQEILHEGIILSADVQVTLKEY